MPDILKLKNYECTGCGACWNVCPVGCIKPAANEEGFVYPTVGSACVECSLCANACPILNGKTELTPEINQDVYAAVSNDRKICHASTSGGAFTEICNSYGDDETIVFGARFIGLKVVHSYVTGVENIAPFRKSKYVQSDIGSSYKEAEGYLKEGKKVIFSGTPCQIEVLKSELGKIYDNLLSVDFICHGVGSPALFELYVDFVEQKYGKQVHSYGFRNQVGRFGNIEDCVSNYIFEDGEVVYNSVDPYQSLFIKQLCLRESCGENCKFRNPNRVSDITIADFKDKLIVFPKMLDSRNYSTVVFNTKAGIRLLEKMSTRMKMLRCSMNDLKEHNPLFFYTTKANPDRAKFFDAYRTSNISEIIERFLPNRPEISLNFFQKIRSNYIPYVLKRCIRVFIDQFKPRK